MTTRITRPIIPLIMSAPGIEGLGDNRAQITTRRVDGNNMRISLALVGGAGSSTSAGSIDLSRQQVRMLISFYEGELEFMDADAERPTRPSQT